MVKKRASQNKGETAAEYLRRVVANINCEAESILDDLPSPEAVLDYIDLWVAYDTEFLSGIRESISDGASPELLRAFIKKHKLTWADGAQ